MDKSITHESIAEFLKKWDEVTTQLAEQGKNNDPNKVMDVIMKDNDIMIKIGAKRNEET